MTLFAAALVLSLLAAAWVVHPVYARRRATLRDAAPSSVLDAEARRRVALASLREVEYDWLAGKLDAADYEALRSQLGREALDAVRAAPRAAGSDGEGGPPAEHARCGFANPPGSRFCAGCGERLG